MTTTTTSNTYPLSGALNAFLSSFAGTGAVLVASHGQATGPVLDGNPTETAPLTSLLGNEPPVSGQTPKAYISWIIFDDQFRAVSMGSDPVNTTADVVKSHTMTGISVPKNGFIYIFCSNESNQDVYFDNLQVVHTRGPLIQEQHYYPQGLTMTGISSAAFGKLQANYGYQGKEMQAAEFSDTTGLEEYDFAARYYDPQLGRWWTRDPDEENFPDMSPYAAMMDNPTTYTDPDGKCPTCLAVVIGALVGAGINVATHWQQITAGGFHWDKFGEAALIGGGAGAVAVLTGGAGFAAAGGAAAGAGEFLAGAAGGAISSAYAGEVEGIGNAIAFGDRFSPQQWAEGVAFGAITGGLFNGVSALAHDRGFLRGNLLPRSYALPLLDIGPEGLQNIQSNDINVPQSVIGSPQVNINNQGEAEIFTNPNGGLEPTLSMGAEGDAAKTGVKYSDDLVKAAQQLYPQKQCLRNYITLHQNT